MLSYSISSGALDSSDALSLYSVTSLAFYIITKLIIIIIITLLNISTSTGTAGTDRAQSAGGKENQGQGRPVTPDLTVNKDTGMDRDAEHGLKQAVVLLQRLIRGRSVQNVMYVLILILLMLMGCGLCGTSHYAYVSVTVIISRALIKWCIG